MRTLLLEHIRPRLPRVSAIAALLLCFSGAALTGCGSSFTQPPVSPGIDRYPEARDLHQFAEQHRVRHRLPALGVGIIHQGRIVGLGVAGERARGSGAWAAVDDAFDVGSIAKSVTATVAAVLVQEGAIRWDSTPAELFPEARTGVHAGYAGLTLELLLRHRGGVGHEMNRNDRWAGWQRDHRALSPAGQRRAFALATLRAPPRFAPGAATFYTSDGYLIAGSMLERAAGSDFERLARERRFAPLGLASMTYGGEADSAPGVLGHEPRWLGPSRPVAYDAAEYGARPFGAPAGFLRASVPDLLRWVDFHIRGERGLETAIESEALRRLHRPPPGEPFALAWQVDVVPATGDEPMRHSVSHGGYTGRSRANVWFVPETGWGTAIVANDGQGDESIAAETFYALLREFNIIPRK